MQKGAYSRRSVGRALTRSDAPKQSAAVTCRRPADDRIPIPQTDGPPNEGRIVMFCAIYARKSTDQNGVADEAKSVTRQNRPRYRLRGGEGLDRHRRACLR